MSCNHLIDLADLPMEQWDNIIHLALKIEQNPRDFYGIMEGKILATLFYEPSTLSLIHIFTPYTTLLYPAIH